jgi:hypothetical protein
LENRNINLGGRMYQRKFRDKILRHRDQIVSKNKETKQQLRNQEKKENALSKCSFVNQCQT